MIAHLNIANTILTGRSNSISQFMGAMEEQVVAAYHLGCIAPDFGMYPGGLGMFSDCAHYMRTGELCKKLLKYGETSKITRAFAYGWISHYWADRMIHPKINEEAGLRVNGSREKPIAYAENPEAHVAVELGLDASLVSEGYELKIPSAHTLELVKDLLSAAYLDVYGIELRAGIEKTISAFLQWHKVWRSVAIWHAAEVYGTRPGVTPAARLLFRTARLLSKVLPSPYMLKGAFRVYEPTKWLRDSFANETEGLVATFARTDFSKLEFHDLNLDTGRHDQGTYSLALSLVETVRRLQLTQKSIR